MILIGGAARSEAVRRIAPVIFGVPVTVPEPAEYVALGAARQAAWALSGAPEPPLWPLAASTSAECTADPVPGPRAIRGPARRDGYLGQYGRLSRGWWQRWTIGVCYDGSMEHRGRYRTRHRAGGRAA